MENSLRLHTLSNAQRFATRPECTALAGVSDLLSVKKQGSAMR